MGNCLRASFIPKNNPLFSGKVKIYNKFGAYSFLPHVPIYIYIIINKYTRDIENIKIKIITY